jgi:methylated-DNA-[protein]-cysteine S-methyltransferase
MSNEAWTIYESPIGPLTLIGGSRGLSAIHFPERTSPQPDRFRDDEALAPAVTQLEEYFAGERRSFDLEPAPRRGSSMYREVWDELLRIPYGTTTTYGELARRVGRPDLARAIGGAVGSTPTPIVVPCHRVIGADGSLTGYGGGLDRKRALLDLESRTVAGMPPGPAWAFRQAALL